MYAALISAKSAGVTTTTAAIAATVQPGAALAIELDPSGGDIAAWSERSADPSLPSLVDLVRRGEDVASLLDQPPGHGPLLVMAPTNGATAEAVLSSALPNLGNALSHSPALVLGDLGRWALSQPTASRLDGADVSIVVARATPSSIEHARHLVTSLSTTDTVPAALIVGDSRYTTEEIEPVLGCRVLTRIPWDPPAVDALFREGPASRRFRRSRLGAAARTTIDGLIELMETGRAA